MLVIISDLHLTDGTSGETIRVGAFRAFRERLRDLAYDASWRADGRYEPIKDLHLVLLGDILDVIRSTKWLSDGVRPWNIAQNEEAFLSQFTAINDAILKHNADSLRVLKSLNDGKTTTLPPATLAGKPAKVSREPGAKDREPVEVHIHYLVGNHDWFYHLPGNGYDKLRQSVVKTMGLANRAGTPFPHDPSESDILPKVFAEHGVFARHGDIYDPFNYEDDRNASSLGDAIVIELLSRFSEEVPTQMGKALPKQCAQGLREIDNVRPLLVVPIWIDGLLRKTCTPTMAKSIKAIWDELADQFLGLDFVRERDSILTFADSVDRLEWALKFSQGVSFSNLSRLLSWIREKAITEKSYYAHALTETDFKNREARFLVYGHTHHHELVPLDSVDMPQGSLNQIYINSGTWRRVHELAKQNPNEREFMGYNVMTYLAFFKGDERRGRQFESWSGCLGTDGMC